MSPNLLFHVHLGFTPFKEMPLVQNVKLDRLVLILLRHLNTVLVALTVKRFVPGYMLYQWHTLLSKEYVWAIPGKFLFPTVFCESSKGGAVISFHIQNATYYIIYTSSYFYWWWFSVKFTDPICLLVAFHMSHSNFFASSCVTHEPFATLFCMLWEYLTRCIPDWVKQGLLRLEEVEAY